jgi:hypothetical protein
MNINIQITGLPGNQAVAIDPDRSASVTPVSDEAIDAGAPRAISTGETVSPSDIGVLDVGGPPQSLTEAIGTERAAAPAASSGPATEAGESTDAGPAPAL